jgi:predicted phage terminase large subunit-like protein
MHWSLPRLSGGDVDLPEFCHPTASASRPSPKKTRSTGSRRSGDRDASPAFRARLCTPSASRSKPSNISGGRSANTISQANISNRPPRWAVAWSRRNGSSATARTSGQSASIASCRVGTPPTRRPSSAIYRCTTWGVKGKDLFLLGLFRKRLEYPALKRAVIEQQSLFNASVVLIEDKASGTQLIQELIADGCHGVKRYQPTTDKIMRVHAQTAVIENGFATSPRRRRGWPNTSTNSPSSQTGNMTTKPTQPRSSSTGLKRLSQGRESTSSTAGNRRRPSSAANHNLPKLYGRSARWNGSPSRKNPAEPRACFAARPFAPNEQRANKRARHDGGPRVRIPVPFKAASRLRTWIS